MLTAVENGGAGRGLRRLKVAAAEHPTQPPGQESLRLERQLASLQSDLEKVGRKMALAETPDQRNVTAIVFNELSQKATELRRLIAAEASRGVMPVDVERQVEVALDALCGIQKPANDKRNLPAITAAFERVNARLFLKCTPVKQKRRTVNRVCEGVVTFGSAPSPVPLYQGPTGRRALQKNVAEARSIGSEHPVGVPTNDNNGEEDKSLGNVNRGDGPSFERAIATVVDAALSPNAETIVAHRVVRLSA